MDISLKAVACSRDNHFDAEIQMRVTNGMDKDFNWIVVENAQVKIEGKFSTRKEAEDKASEIIKKLVGIVVKEIKTFPIAKD